MNKPLEILATVLLLGGLAGVAHHFVGWFHTWGFIRLIPLLRDHELPSGVVLAVLGLGLFVAGDALSKRSGVTDRDEPS